LYLYGAVVLRSGSVEIEKNVNPEFKRAGWV
jgi:hypothetical protein